jgi:hypothetical protein
MSFMQEENQSNRCQDKRSIAARCGNDSMHGMQLHDGCTDRDFKCQRMNLNARCAKSVLRWISQSMRNETHNAAGNQWAESIQHQAFHSRVKAGVVNE